MKKSFAAIVVTYNREKLLVECLEALSKQTCSPDAIFIIDNKSNNATPDVLKKEGWIDTFPDTDKNENQIQEKVLHHIKIIYVRKCINDGGAGGFYEGIKQAYNVGYDYFWIMDDDVIPENSALEELSKVKQLDQAGFLCSRVVGTNGISMNMPEVDFSKGDNYYSIWDEHLQDGLVRVRTATFVSVCFSRRIIEEVGFPVRQMFIWGDDYEYTLRISKKYPSYLVGKSVVCHKRAISKPPSIKTEKNKGRIKMHFYRFRNQIYYTRKHFGFSQLIMVLLEAGFKFGYVAIRFRFFSCYTILKGVLAGLVFNPKIEYPENS